MQTINMLTWWQWAILAAVLPAIVLLYFLKLKRRPVEVPSTYLWHRSIEDLHVNTIWQRLRRNLLLFLQILLLILAMLAVLRPGWRGTALTGDRFIFLIDNSASMRATDVEPSRLEEAKRQARLLIDEMESGDVAMVVSFADTPKIEEMFTDNRRRLRQAVDDIQATERPTSLLEALKVASGLANPGRTADDVTDVQVAEPLPATLLIFSDGKFANASGFALGNLDAVYKPIGNPESVNLGVTTFSVRRNEARPEQLQAFAQVQNFSAKTAEISLELRLDGKMINADRFQLAGEEARGVTFDLGAFDSGILQLTATTGDDLAVDDVAWAVVNPPRRARALLVTPGVEPLEFALSTSAAMELADLTVQTPSYLDQEAYRQQAAMGGYDLVIYDRCQPKQMPQANTLWIGVLPPVGDWKAEPKVSAPQIIDTDPAHPLMQWLNLGNVLVAEGAPLGAPSGGTVLIDSHVGPLFAVAPRGRFEDAVLGFVFLGNEAGGGGGQDVFIGTNWPIRASFPLFVLNVLQYLGGGQTSLGGEALRPGQPVLLESASPARRLEVRTPSAQIVRLEPSAEGKASFTGTGQLGVYDVRIDGKDDRHFAVNLFQASESDIRPVSDIRIGHVDVAAQTGWETARREMWRVLLLAGLVVLGVEWYTYNRRVSW
ncbi:MAG: VWA domain-containing protein [Pirellulales bacterium]|nr:VWA domain-containing protein [Pirellulales bacterium]